MSTVAIPPRMRRLGRPSLQNPTLSVAYRVDPAIVARLREFCKGGDGRIRLGQSAIVELAITRLLDATQDDPRNLFK